MQIKESQLRAKSGDENKNEDAIVFTDCFAGVIDGATDKTGRLFDGVPGGRFAATRLSEAIQDLDADSSPRAAIDFLSQRLADACAEFELAEGDRPSATVALYSASRREIWRVGGDAVRIAGRSLVRRKPTEVSAAEARSVYLRQLIAEGASIDELRARDPGRALILPILEREYLFRNTEDGLGFGALDGSNVPAVFLDVMSVAARTEVILATDGYPVVFDTLDESERWLQQSLLEDPLRIYSHPATKGMKIDHVSFDDRAYLRLTS